MDETETSDNTQQDQETPFDIDGDDLKRFSLLTGVTEEDSEYVQRIDDLVLEGLRSVEFYSRRDNNEVEKIWQDNPSKMIESMQDIFRRMEDTWSEYYSFRDQKEKTINEIKAAQIKKNDEEFKKVYLEKFTDAFSNEIEAMRLSASNQNVSNEKSSFLDNDSILAKNMNISVVEESAAGVNKFKDDGSSMDLKVLIDLLESGSDLWTQEEKELLLQENNTLNAV